MATPPDRSVDVVITDPPYEAEAHTAHRMAARAGGRLECEPIAFPPFTEEQRTESARHMARLARRWILVFCQVEAAMKWRAALESGGAVYKRTCQWIKPDGTAGPAVSDRDELILDPFTGLGSTGVAALRQRRRFAGWEMNPEYAKIARRRIKGCESLLD